MKKHIPNAMTVLRILLAVAFPFIPQGWWLPVLAVAAITEFGDGFLARRWKVGSDFGRLVDPIADKLFVFAMLLTFLFDGAIELWEVALLGTRDIVVASGATWVFLFRDRTEFDLAKPRIIGKITTNFQFAVLLSLVLVKDIHVALFIATSIISVFAAIDYARYYVRVIHQPAS